MLYRAGSAFEWDGKPTDTLIVEDFGSYEAAARDGWLSAAEYTLDAPLLANADVIPIKRRGRPPKEQVA